MKRRKYLHRYDKDFKNNIRAMQSSIWVNTVRFYVYFFKSFKPF